MIIDWVRGLLFLLPLGFTLFFSRLYLLRNRKDKKHILVQIIVLVMYWSIILALVYFDLKNGHYWNTPYIVYIWLGYYFAVEPLVSYIALFKYHSDPSLKYSTYFIVSMVWTFILTFIAVFILVMWYIYTGNF